MATRTSSYSRAEYKFTEKDLKELGIWDGFTINVTKMIEYVKKDLRLTDEDGILEIHVPHSTEDNSFKVIIKYKRKGAIYKYVE